MLHEYSYTCFAGQVAFVFPRPEQRDTWPDPAHSEPGGGMHFAVRRRWTGVGICVDCSVLCCVQCLSYTHIEDIIIR